jgi:hypothetical protein
MSPGASGTECTFRTFRTTRVGYDRAPGLYKTKRGAILSDRPRAFARSQEGYFFFLAAFFVDFLAAFFVAFFLAAFFAMRNHPLRGM